MRKMGELCMRHPDLSEAYRRYLPTGLLVDAFDDMAGGTHSALAEQFIERALGLRIGYRKHALAVAICKDYTGARARSLRLLIVRAGAERHASIKLVQRIGHELH
jgi:hypothetical protein